MALPKPAYQMISEACAEIAAETPITATGPDSLLYRLLKRPYEDLESYWMDAATRDDQYSLATASGTGLDDIGELFGVPRLAAQAGNTSTAGVRFYVAAPAPADITIPAGTQLWSPATPSVYFLTQSTVIIPQGGIEAFTACRAPASGSSFTAAARSLTKHNATGPVTISCTNLEAVAGSDDETDENYRFRLSQARGARNLTNAAAIRMGLLSYPGVRDITFTNYRNGAGTIEVVVYHNEPTINAQTLELLQSYAETLVAEGIAITVVAPTVITLDLTARIAFASDVVSTQYADIRARAASHIRDFIINLAMGQPFIPADMIAALNLTLGGIGTISLVQLRQDGTTIVPDTVYASDRTRIVPGIVEII